MYILKFRLNLWAHEGISGYIGVYYIYLLHRIPCKSEEHTEFSFKWRRTLKYVDIIDGTKWVCSTVASRFPKILHYNLKNSSLNEILKCAVIYEKISQVDQQFFWKKCQKLLSGEKNKKTMFSLLWQHFGEVSHHQMHIIIVLTLSKFHFLYFSSFLNNFSSVLIQKLPD